MRTATAIKTDVDSQITNKTQPYSIDNVDVGNRIKDVVDRTVPLQFTTSAARVSYLTDPSAVPFQIADDLQDGNKYYINSAGNAWVQIGANTPKTEVVAFINQTTLTITWDATRQAKFGAAASFVVETLDPDGKYRQKQVEIYPDDIVNTTSYHIDLGGGAQSGRIIIK